MTEITLTDSELKLAATVAIERNIENIFEGRKHAHGFGGSNGWDNHIEGAAGEMAFAKFANKFWSGNIGNLDANDVGRVEVRTASDHNRRLIIHKRDPDDRAFVLVTGLAPTFRIRGWIWGEDAKQDRYWKDPAGGRPAYFVPHQELKPLLKDKQARAA